MNGYARSRLQTEYASRVTGAFALLDPPSTTVMGFYTLSPTEIKATQATAAGMIEQHPYPGVGGALLGRLGVSVALQGQGFGTLLVTHAIKECVASPMRPRCVIVDAKDDNLCNWYTGEWGFVRFAPNKRRMVLRLF